jgi:hypothetical protein
MAPGTVQSDTPANRILPVDQRDHLPNINPSENTFRTPEGVSAIQKCDWA